MQSAANTAAVALRTCDRSRAGYARRCTLKRVMLRSVVRNALLWALELVKNTVSLRMLPQFLILSLPCVRTRAFGCRKHP
jgi:hypothetical protein